MRLSKVFFPTHNILCASLRVNKSGIFSYIRFFPFVAKNGLQRIKLVYISVLCIIRKM